MFLVILLLGNVVEMFCPDQTSDTWVVTRAHYSVLGMKKTTKLL